MKIHDMMVVKIHQYFTKHLRISDEEASKLHHEYYKSYGLALEGLVRHHKIGSSPHVCAEKIRWSIIGRSMILLN
jgi:hypothetical protein